MRAFLALAASWSALLACTCVDAVAAPAAASVPASAASAGGNDTVEMLYHKLSERLGSARQPTSDGSLLLRVPARPAAAPATHHARAKASARAAETTALHGAWSYSGDTGPQAWARLAPDYAQCASGKRQSPIDLRDGFAVELEPIQFDYHPSAFRVIDNGHTVQVNVAPGNAIQVLGRRYELQQFHFHRPSEHRIAGQGFEMEVHLVHKDEAGHIAVVAVLLQRGAANPIVQAVWNNLPLEKGEEQPARVSLDPAGLLPEDRRYFTYMGSLTTPPCSEGVLWMVLQQPAPLAGDQADLFARLYPLNERPLQPPAGRMIKASK